VAEQVEATRSPVEQKKDVGAPSADANADATTDADATAAGPQDVALNQAGALLSAAVLGLVRVLARRGRRQAHRAATVGRAHLDLRQLRHDRDVMVQKLGREVCALVDGDEVHHPGLVRGVQRIRELDGRITALQAALPSTTLARSEPASDPTPDPQDPTSTGAKAPAP